MTVCVSSTTRHQNLRKGVYNASGIASDSVGSKNGHVEIQHLPR